MNVEQVIKALQDIVEGDKDLAYRKVRLDDGAGDIINQVYVDLDDEGDPTVVIY